MAAVASRAYPADVDDEQGIVRADEEIRRVLAHARAGIERYRYGEELHPEDLARPWGNGRWMDNAWLRGVRDLLEWALGETKYGPVSGLPAAGDRPTIYEMFRDTPNIDELMLQGHRRPVVPGWPPPQSAEAMNATLKWLQGRTDEAPATAHGGAYQYNEDWADEPAAS